MKDFRDDELKKFIEEQYEKETDQMEKALSSNENLEKYEETEEKLEASYNRLIERLKADGVYREEENGDSDAAYNEIIKLKKTGSTAEHGNSKSAGAEPMFRAENRSYKNNIPGRDEKIREYRPKKSWKQKITRAAATVAVCACCVFAASMTSEANRRYVIDTVHYWAGDDTKIVIDNDKNNDNELTNEDKDREYIGKKLDLNLPEFFYKPEGLQYLNSTVDENVGTACMQYSYKGNIIQFFISKSDKNSESMGVSMHGNNVESIESLDPDLKIKMMTVMDKNDEKPTYVGNWYSDTVWYEIIGKMDRDEFIKILKKIAS